MWKCLVYSGKVLLLDSFPLKEKAHYAYCGIILYFKGAHLKESKGHKKMEPEEKTRDTTTYLQLSREIEWWKLGGIQSLLKKHLPSRRERTQIKTGDREEWVVWIRWSASQEKKHNFKSIQHSFVSFRTLPSIWYFPKPAN